MPSQLNRMHGVVTLEEATVPQLVAELNRKVTAAMTVLAACAERVEETAPEAPPAGALVPGARVRSALQPHDRIDGLHGRYGTLERIDDDRGTEGTVAQFSHLVALDSNDGGPAHLTWFRPDELVVVE